MKRVCISATGPSDSDRFTIGEFRDWRGASLGTRVSFLETGAYKFAAGFDAVISWNRWNRDVVRRIHENADTLCGLALAVEAVPAAPQHDPGLEILRQTLLPFAVPGPVDYFWRSTVPWPRKPHVIAIDFENHGPAIADRVLRWVHDRPPGSFDFLFADSMQGWRLWYDAPGAPASQDAAYRTTWRTIAERIQATRCPVWSHNAGQCMSYPTLFRVEEHFYRLPASERIVMASTTDYVVRESEWRDIQRVGLATIRAEIDRDEKQSGRDAWIVTARSGNAFALFDV